MLPPKQQLSKIDTLIKVLRGQIIGAIHDCLVLHPDYKPDQGECQIDVRIDLTDSMIEERVIDRIEVVEETGEFLFSINGDEICDAELTLEELRFVLKGLSKNL